MRISDWRSDGCSSDLIPSDPLCETEGGMMIGIADQCINRWPSILPQFGISPSYLTGKQTPCPTCGGKDRFRFDNKDGRGTYYCNKCGPGDGVQLVMMKTGWPASTGVWVVKTHMSRALARSEAQRSPADWPRIRRMRRSSSTGRKAAWPSLRW